MKEKQSLVPTEMFGSDERILVEVNEAIQRVREAKTLEEVDTKDLLIVIALHFEKTLSGFSGLGEGIHSLLGEGIHSLEEVDRSFRKGIRSLKKFLYLTVGTLWLIAGALWLNVILSLIQKLS